MGGNQSKAKKASLFDEIGDSVSVRVRKDKNAAQKSGKPGGFVPRKEIPLPTKPASSNPDEGK
eukprot:CAMPEP_0194072708 /NCGR_PEP_ID=MMETSP0149-20130528/374_1 /TAXON_ID=122233 /ORGANISM="Chaetoceros debilis, Strain MM31A-1" /LENGTH=62 /DNA_ID=CAMNT_0038752613 /DNA_START=189 /DNA_END=377 /DNA_ORIENTATION=+